MPDKQTAGFNHSIEHGHTLAAIRARIAADPEGSYLRDFIYGAIDGAVTTFAVVSGVAGAGLPTSVIVILGVANLVGDGFSMAAGNFLGTRADEELRHRKRRMEERHIEMVPDGERNEIREIFRNQGFTGADLERVVEVITADRDRWVNTMLKEEHGIALLGPKPLRAALTTFYAFLLVGIVPLLPFLASIVFGWSLPHPYLWSTILTSLSFFAVGAVKSRFVEQHWFRSGGLTLLIGGAAATLAYLCGMLLQRVV